MTPTNTRLAAVLTDHDSYLRAVATARAAADAYYGAGESGLDDEAYDRLLRAITAWEQEHPGQAAADSPTRQVAAGVTSGDVAHRERMLSLGNVFSAEELTAWASSLERRLGGRAVAGWSVEPKLDGVALAARYRDGRLVQLVTRGDGSTGEDVSHAIGAVLGLPTGLTEPVTVEVRGEVLMTTAQFEAANEQRLAHDAPVFANRRNASSGSLRAKDRNYRVEQTFIGYAALTAPEHTTDLTLKDLTHTQLIARLSRRPGPDGLRAAPTGPGSDLHDHHLHRRFDPAHAHGDHRLGEVPGIPEPGRGIHRRTRRRDRRQRGRHGHTPALPRPAPQYRRCPYLDGNA